MRKIKGDVFILKVVLQFIKCQIIGTDFHHTSKSVAIKSAERVSTLYALLREIQPGWIEWGGLETAQIPRLEGQQPAAKTLLVASKEGSICSAYRWISHQWAGQRNKPQVVTMSNVQVCRENLIKDFTQKCREFCTIGNHLWHTCWHCKDSDKDGKYLATLQFL